MTFLILPSQVEVIINELEFTGFKYGQPGQVRMDVWDGVDDASCLNAEEHNAASVHFGCYHVGAAISIPAVSHRDGEIGSTEEGFVRELFEFQDLPDFIFWGTVLMIMVCCCLGVRRCCDCMRSCRARGSKIPIDMHEQMRHRRPIAWEYNPGSHNV
uniref:Uncharacterized protein n=1 Tax=Craspedostauros australis TaxID=1486917 RepID=A0A7R9ZLV0_9STRA